jgi:hypothetical protein
MEPVKRKVKVVEAEYIKEAESILIVGEHEGNKMRTQISKSCFSFGTRTEAEIDKEMEKTASLMIGKNINLVFDEDLENKIECNEGLSY